MQEEIQVVLQYNKPKYNYYKLAEELAELSEVILKRYGKKEENAPPLSKIIEEMGDVLLRMKILATMENIQEEVNTRMNVKLTKLMEYISENKYKGGV